MKGGKLTRSLWREEPGHALRPSLSLHCVISLGPRVRRVPESTAETQRLHRVKRHKSFVLLFTVQYVCIILIHLFFIEVDSIST